MATKMGLLVVEGRPDDLDCVRGGRIPPWYREIKTTSDDPELKALLSPSPDRVGSFIAKEAERECRKIHACGPVNVSLWVEDWDQFQCEPLRLPTCWAEDDDKMYDDEYLSDGGICPNTFRKLVRLGIAPPPLRIPGLGRDLFDKEQQDQAIRALRSEKAVA